MSDIVPRDIHPTLRDRQRESTRRLLVDAFTQVILRDGIHDFSMQAVADEARCSLRTLYRYFPNREALIDGLDAETDAFVESCLDRAPETGSEELAELMERLAVLYDERSDLVRAWAAADLDTRLRTSVHQRVRALIDAAVDQAAPALSADEHARVFSALRLVVSRRSWLSLTDHLTADDAAMTAGWIIRTLLADLANGGGPKRD
ncbi:TetR/AcrR family transcriptional regulator [Agromyces sp. NPDC058484]|uniref:TetR/AcrR family transcriptional regulator n=1 Tax=Agromyces sp. NPDC058484 TaxID=3346524 RepID=UPI00365ADC9C